MQHLIEEYRLSLKTVKRGIRELEKELQGDITEWEKTLLKERISTLNGYVGNLEYSIEWMETCRRPQSRRGVENLAAYQREYSTDDINRARIIDRRVSIENAASYEDEITINSYLALFSPQEREAFTLVKGNNFSYEEAAVLMGCGKSTVQCYVERAEYKIYLQKQGEMQLIML